MDELLERGLVAAMRDRLGLSEEDFGTTVATNTLLLKDNTCARYRQRLKRQDAAVDT